MSALVPALLAAAAAGVAAGVPVASRGMRGGQPAAVSPVGPARVQARVGLQALAGPLLAGLVLLVVLGPAAGVLGLLLGALAGRAWVRHGRAQGRAAERAGAAEALAVLAGELSAGRPPEVALEVAATVAVGPFAVALATAAGGSQVGADPAVAMLRAAAGSAVPEVLRGLAACWQVCGSTGSSLALAVTRLAEGLRADRAQRLAVEAELAGPRATAGLLAVLPLAGIGLAAGLGANPLHVLLKTPLGLGCLVVGVALDLVGVWWTGRLVSAAGGER